MEPPSPAPAARKDELLGKTLAGRFRLDDVVGRGDWGVLYQALDLRRSQPIAVKVMHRDLPPEVIVGRMKAARAYTSVRHERLGKISAAKVQGSAWIATEWMGGVSLRRMLRRHGHLSPRRTVELMLHLCRAVRPLHAAGLVHGNLKPNNIFLVPTQRGDFLRLVDPGADTDYLYAEAAITPKWASPEQLQQALTQASDVFGIGLIGYRMLSGRAPFFGATPQLTREALAACTPLPLKSVVPNAPWRLIKTIGRCLEADPKRRFPGVDSLLATLSECLGETEAVPEAQSVSSERAVMVVRRTVIGEHETPAVPGPSAALLRAAAPDGWIGGRGAPDAQIDDAISQVTSLTGEVSHAGVGAPSMAGTGEIEIVQDAARSPRDVVPDLPIDDEPPDLFDSLEADVLAVGADGGEGDWDADVFAPSWRRVLGKAVRRMSGGKS